MSVRGDSPDDPQPIREGATPMGQRVAGGGGRGGFGPAGGGPSDFETGGFGPGGGPGGPGFNEEMMEDGMGEMEDMGQMEGMGEMEEMGAAGGFGRPAARPNPVADTAARPQRSMLSAQADETLQEPLGLVAEIAAESFDKRFKQGAFGSLFTSVTAPAVAPPTTQQTGFGNRTVPVASPVTTSNDLEEVLVNVPQPLPMWKPGIVFVGQNVDSDELLAQARATGLDLLMHFDVVLKEGRDGQVSNLSRCRLLRVSSGKSLGVSKSFDSNEAANFAAAGRMNEREYVEEQFSNFWGIVDREVTVQPMPPLKAAAAQSRIASLLSSADSNSLRTLAEVRLFQSAGLITDEEAELAFHIVGGSDGLVMMHGPREQRQEKVRQWTRGNKD